MAERIILSSSTNNPQRGSPIKPRAEPIPRPLQVAASSSPHWEKSSFGFESGHRSVASSLKVGVGGARANRCVSPLPPVCVLGGSDDPLLRSSPVAEYEQNGTGERTIRTAIGTPGSKASQEHASDGRACVSSFGGEASQDEQYEVFLSFRGADTRNNFVDMLRLSFEYAGVRVFLDDRAIRVGKRISNELIKAIHSSKIFMPVFSKNYATSVSCLMELGEMVKCSRSFGQRILPIYYDVTPSDVSLHQGPYIEALHQHRQRFDLETVHQWEEALKEVTKMKGWELENETNGFQGLFAKFIVCKVLEQLKTSWLKVPQHFLMLDDHVEKMMRLLEVGSEDVRFIVLYGISGIGKSTLAKYIYNLLFSQFECCAFLQDIQQNLRKEGLKSLLALLGSRLLRENSPESDGTDANDRRFSAKDVLIVLDDVGEENQIEELVGKRSRFGPGSRIIITTRNKDILNFPEVDFSYELSGMDFDQSLTLFCWHAFGREYPLDEYVEYSKRAVGICGGHPLALEVIASCLSTKPREAWDRSLKMLEEVSHAGVQEMFRIILKDLRKQQMQIFLDIALFFVGVDIRIAFHMWDAQTFPEVAVEELRKGFLIKIVDDSKLWVHDLLRDVAAQIVRSGNGRPLEQSRWCNHGEALKLLEAKEGTEVVEGLALDFDSRHPYALTPDEFQCLPNLRFLQLNGGKLAGNFQGLLLKLRWFKWHHCPLEILPKYLDLPNVAVLDLSWSMMSEDWQGWGLFETAVELKVMILRDCSKLTRTPAFSAFPALERLTLECCEQLMELHPSLGRLSHLVSLDLRDCTSIEKLPGELFSLEALEELRVDRTRIREICTLPDSLKKLKTLSARGCVNLTKVHISIGSLESISELVLDNTNIAQLPGSIGSLSKLKVLSLRGCRHLSELPESIGQLELLVDLDLSNTGIIELPGSFGKLKCLKVLRLDGSLLESFPCGIEKLEKLEEMYVEDCSLEGQIMSDICELSYLRVLVLSGNPISCLPTSMSKLSHLEILLLKDCDELQALPELPSSLTNLCVSSQSLRKIPDLSNLVNLKILYLSDGLSLRYPSNDAIELLQPPSLRWIGKLSKLERLHLSLSTITSLPTDLGTLPRLRKLVLTCANLKEVQGLDKLGQLQELHISGCRSMKRLPVLSNLKELRVLEVEDCEKVPDTDGLDKLQSLEKLRISGCGKIGRLPNLSNLEKLKVLEIENCEKITCIEGYQSLESLEVLSIVCCRAIEGVLDLSSFRNLKKLCIRDCDRVDKIIYPPTSRWSGANQLKPGAASNAMSEL